MKNIRKIALVILSYLIGGCIYVVSKPIIGIIIGFFVSFINPNMSNDTVQLLADLATVIAGILGIWIGIKFYKNWKNKYIKI